MELRIFYRTMRTFVWASANPTRLVVARGLGLSFCVDTAILSEPLVSLAVRLLSSYMSTCSIRVTIRRAFDMMMKLGGDDRV